MKAGRKFWILLVAAAVVVAVVAAGGWAYYEGLRRGWIRYNEYDIRSEGILQVGDLVPELAITRLEDGVPVSLSDLYRERPLVLVFGSYT